MMNRILITAFLLMLPSVSNANKTWIKIAEPASTRVTKTQMTTLLKSEIRNNAAGFIKAKNLIRIEINGGGGPKGLSETVIYFKSLPFKALATASTDIKGRSGVMISQYQKCPWDEKTLQHNCPGGGIANEGPIDIFNIVKQKHLLVVSRSASKDKAKTIIWLGADAFPLMYYYNIKQPHFGMDSIAVKTFNVVADPKPDLPPDPTDIVQPVVKPEVKPVVKPEVKPEIKPEVKPEIKPEVKPDVQPIVEPVAPPVVPVKPAVAIPAGFKRFPFKKVNASPLGRMKKDYITDPAILNSNLHWVRIQMSGLDYKNYADFTADFQRKPDKVYIFAWTDNVETATTFIGDSKTCKPDMTRGCPYKINGKQWYDFSSIIKSPRFEVRSGPSTKFAGNFIMWVGFKTLPGYAAWKSTKTTGVLNAHRYSNAAKTVEAPIDVAAPVKTAVKPVAAKSPLKSLTPLAFSTMLKRHGIDAEASGLLNYKYIVRIALRPKTTGKSIIDIKLPGTPDFVLARSTGKARAKFRSQMGPVSRCQGDACPYHFHGLGW
ncbi:hypothetical protein KKD49_12765, partial [Myxococcota bacterium]|nr:hypothetical protein [Myxococcota bacterium]